LAFAPRNATHAFHNPTNAVTTFLTVNSPAGHERGFQMIAREQQSDRLEELLVAHGWADASPGDKSSDVSVV
jgi:hypothetical protein